jgi:hypothetical protein
LILLPQHHSAIRPIKKLLENVPKFNVNTPVPPKKHDLIKLHQLNLATGNNYLYQHRLSLPPNFELMSLHPQNLNILDKHLCQTLSFNHPFRKLHLILNESDLVIVPADKTKILVILPNSVLKEELTCHMTDKETYSILTQYEQQLYVKQQKEVVIDAVLYYKKQNLLVTNPSMRYIYFLPKIHKPLQEWRTLYLHPKMRPIVSDTNSITYNLSKHLLPRLQLIENLITSSVQSSLVVSKNIQNVNNDLSIISSPTMTTIDVESLFTRIKQEVLLNIINSFLIKQNTDDKEREQFMKYLNVIVKFNTFQVNDYFCLQKIGLPMGGVLSGCLANIYLGYMEKECIGNPNLLLYNRYMDDILIISTFSYEELMNFIAQLQFQYQLTVTSSSNQHAVTFLDLCIFYSPTRRQFFTYPFSKRCPIYPIPSLLVQRKFSMDKNIIISQILRTWRISNHNREFSSCVNHYLQFLQDSAYHQKLRKSIFKFLLPTKIHSHLWSTEIPICTLCLSILKELNVRFQKILVINNRVVSIKQPLNCYSSTIYCVCQTEEICALFLISSLHSDLQQRNPIFLNSNLLPLGVLHERQLKQFLLKHPSIYFSSREKILSEKEIFPCALYNIFKNTSDAYGIPTMPKKTKCVSSFFNKYKYVSR